MESSQHENPVANLNARGLRSNGWWLILEAIAIITSILLAFLIEAWWGERQERNIAERLLISIYEESQENVVAQRFAIRHRTIVRDACLRLFDLAAQETTPDPAEVDDLLGTLSWVHVSQANWGALDTLIEGGQLGLVENEDLHGKLAAQHRLKRSNEGMLVMDEQLMSTSFYPYLRKNALLPQIALTKTALTYPGTIKGKPVYDFSFPLKSPMNHTLLLADPEFLGILIQKLWVQLDAINANQGFLDETLALLKTLEEVLEIES